MSKKSLKILKGFGLIAICFLFFNTAFSAISCGATDNICTVTGTNTTSARFIDGNTYIISGSVTFQNSGVDLNIEPGAVLKFVPSGSSLTITSNARINANGTQSKKIIFTSCRDQTEGRNTSSYPSCSGNPLDQDYGTAISITNTSGMNSEDELSHLRIKYAINGINLQTNIVSIHDVNFTNFGGRSTTGNAITISTTANSTEIYKNHFDINSNFSSSGVNPIRISVDYNGSIRDNNFNNKNYSYGIYVSSGNFTGNIHDNNFTTLISYGIFVDTTGDFNSNIYRNSFDINSNNISGYSAIYRYGNYKGNLYDNNFFLSLIAFGFYKLGTGNVDGNFYNNYFYGNLRPKGIIFTGSGTTNAEIYSNVIDFNGVNTSNYGYGIQISTDFYGTIRDNNFHFKQYVYGIYNDGAVLNATIKDNNFGLDRAYGLYFTSPIVYAVDINSNIVYSETPFNAGYAGSANGYFFYQSNTAGNFSGSICNNFFRSFFNNGIVYSIGNFTGSFCNNEYADVNITTRHLFYNGSNFTGSIRDNNFLNMTSKYTDGILFYFTGSFSGEITRNNFLDFNNVNSGTYLIRLAGSPTSGKISDNNFTKLTGTASTTALAYTGAGTCNTNIEDNNFNNLRGNITTIYQSNGTYAGNIRRNNFVDYNTSNNYVLYTLNVTGNISDNNISDLYNTRVWLQPYGGSFSGDFNNNTISNIYSTTSTQAIGLYSFVSGNFYNNRITNSTNYTYLYSNANFSGKIFNNIFAKNNSATEFIYHISSSPFSGSIYNNTFVDFNNTTSTGIRNSGSFTGSIKRNLFAYGRTGLSGTFAGDVSHNGFFGINTIGGASNQHVGDVNFQTGLTSNPFIGDNTDRNFLLNSLPNGGLLLVDKGDIDSNDFFKRRTTQPNNKLDSGTIDIGYHYDQNGIYASVVSPNGNETITGIQNIDFNIEVGFGEKPQINTLVTYSPSTSLGNTIINNTLDSVNCGNGPIFECSYSWDASDVIDGNYYIVIMASYGDKNYMDYSDAVFLVLSIPKFSLKTYLGSKPRGYYTQGQDVNIVVYTTKANPTINIIGPNNEALVENASMTPVGSFGDMNGYQYNYKAGNNYGWHSIRISGSVFENAFYVTNKWYDKHMDYNNQVFPFSIDVNVTEPNKIQRWFQPLEMTVDFNYYADLEGIKVLDFNGNSYIELPIQVYDVNYLNDFNGKISYGKIAFLASFDKGETRNFFVSYSRTKSDKNYQNDLNISFSGSVYEIENSLLKMLIDLNLGGNAYAIYSKNGTNSNLGGSFPFMLGPESRSGIYTYSSYGDTSPDYYLDLNGPVFSKIRVLGTSGQMDFNVVYYFYAKQNYYITDINARPKSTQNWNYYYDDYKVTDVNKFLRLSYRVGETTSSYDINNEGSGSTTIFGDANYLAAYNRNNSDALGSIYLEKKSSLPLSTTTNFYDDIDYDYWTRQIYTGIVEPSDYFSSKIAHSVFNPWNSLGDLNAEYVKLKNSMNIYVGNTETNDFTPPEFIDWNNTPYDANDITDLNVWARISDNVQIDYVDMNITGPDFVKKERIYYDDKNVLAFYVIDANELNAGTYDVNFRATDIAKNSTLKSWQVNVADKTAPKVWGNKITPDDNSNLDPEVQIVFDANITEYKNITEVNLLLRWHYDENNSWSDWQYLPMELAQSPTDYNRDYNYQYYIPTDLNKQFQYKIYAKDDSGNDANSETYEFYALMDYTYTVSPSDLGVKTGSLDTNIYLGDLNITNTGDEELTFQITNNWDPKKNVYLNSEPNPSAYEVTVPQGSTETIDVNVTTKTTERSDLITITITPKNPVALPKNASVSGTVISLAGGPFMFVEITSYESVVTQGDTDKTFIAKVTNKGSEDANNVVLTWSLPEGWTIKSGSQTATQTSLKVDEELYNSITVDISESASTGQVTLTATATPDSNAQKTRSEQVQVTVIALPVQEEQQQEQQEQQVAGVSSPTAQSTASQPALAFATGSIFSSEEQVKKFFQTIEKFELVRGKDQSFKVKVKNPFSQEIMKNLKASVSGLLSKYLSIENPDINYLGPDQEVSLIVKIIAPKYFEPGKHELDFTIEGTLEVKDKKTTKEIPFTFKSKVTLYIRDMTKEEAQSMLEKTRSEAVELIKQNLNAREILSLLEEAEINMLSGDYDQAAQNTNEAMALIEIAKQAIKELESLDSLIRKSESEMIEVAKTKKMRELAKIAIDRGEFRKALDVLKEAHLTYSIETKGAINYGFFMLQNSTPISLGLASGLVFFILGVILIKRITLKKTIKTLEDEEKLLLELIKDAQVKCFVEGKISMSEYVDTMSQYETKYSQAIEKTIEAKNELMNQISFKTRITKLKEERERILEEIKNNQSLYFEKGLIETRAYQAKMNSLTKRLNEIEKDITYHEATKTIRTKKGIMSLFWRVFYKIFK